MDLAAALEVAQMVAEKLASDENAPVVAESVTRDARSGSWLFIMRLADRG